MSVIADRVERVEVLQDINRHVEEEGYSTLSLALAEVNVLLGQAAHASRTDGRAVIYDKLTLLAAGVARWMEDLVPLVKPGRLEELRELGQEVHGYVDPPTPTSELVARTRAWDELVEQVTSRIRGELRDKDRDPASDPVEDAVRIALREALGGPQS